MVAEPSFGMPAASEKVSSQAKPPSISAVPMSDSRAAIESGYSQPSKAEANESSDSGMDSQPEMKSDGSTKGLPLVITVSALVFVMFCVSIEMTIVSTAIPRITDEFNSLQDIGWYGSAYFMCIAAWQPTWGKFLKYFPLNIAFAITAIGFNIGCVICAVAQNSETLIAGRAVQGALGAGLPPGIYTIIAFVAPPKQKNMVMGALAAVFGIASVLGPILGGVLTDHASWRWVFWINLPISLPAVVVILVFFKPPSAATPPQVTLKEKLLQMDLPGTFVIMGAVICYLLAMQDGGVVRPWNSVRTIGLLVGFGLLLIFFVAIQYLSGERAVFRGREVKNRTLMVMCVIAFHVVAGFQLLLYYLPIYFQSTRSVSAARSGTNMLPIVLSSSFFAIACGVIMSLWGRYVPVILIGSVPMTVGAGLLYTLDVNSSTGKWVGFQLLVGTGCGLVLQVPVMVAQSIVESADISTVTAIIMWSQTIGSAIWVSAGEAGFSNKLLEMLPVRAPNVDPARVLGLGASQIAKVYQGEQLAGVLQAYMDGVKVPFTLVIACFCVVAVAAPFARWESIKGKMVM
ncbi:hypothetical protein H2204_011586 [Knufia peltigerae]|uniref:Major facilitator superfamily (MFS) profile domain-containing protein n=1 Tax=Knufia peltigerae TaxID=1002370 RepID=A0AA38XUB6_9EURO|nr:hypothetical protein H2204_011586 [Knufia peltigerae]